MKPFIILIVVGVIFLALAPDPVFSQTTPNDDRIVVKKSDLPADLVKEIEMKNRLQSYGKWVGMGEEIGIAVDRGLSAVEKHAVDISETRLGGYVMFLIGWKVMGRDLIQVLIGFPLIFIGTIIFIFTWFKNCVTRTFKENATGGDNTASRRVVEPSGQSQAAHVAIYIAFVLICFAIAAA
ncbi:MAG: hypothetical protein V1838_02755 [Patescibacteria group bacterium]